MYNTAPVRQWQTFFHFFFSIIALYHMHHKPALQLSSLKQEINELQAEFQSMLISGQLQVLTSVINSEPALNEKTCFFACVCN